MSRAPPLDSETFIMDTGFAPLVNWSSPHDTALLGDNLLRECDGVGHEDSRRQTHVRAKVSQEGGALPRHRLGHSQNEPIAADRGGESQADSGVAAGGFDDSRARGKYAPSLGVLDQRNTEPVLHAPARVAHFELRQNAARKPLGNLSEFDHRGVADGG